ncbi:MAG: ChbG/HpnK family deacetylase [Acidimicrobiales bacterium]|nr:ChbG/HpnK family deacetylase [Acidimicrobiales bacterium]
MTGPDTLVEKLGLAPDSRALIISVRGLGMSQSSTDACYEAIRDGIATSSSVMVPCCWSRFAAAIFRGEDIGVELTLNAEFDQYRWGPITQAPSLLDGDGGFPRTPEDLWEHADVDETRRECRSQIERAVLWGFPVTHLTTHLQAMERRPELFDVFLEMAEEFSLPIRLSSKPIEDAIGFPIRRLAASAGILFPDHLVEYGGNSSSDFSEFLSHLDHGVTEMVVDVALETPEMRAITPTWTKRVENLKAITDATELDLSKSKIDLIGYRDLCNLMRKGR